MLAKKRQDMIYKMLCRNGAVTTGDLMNTFDVSIETIRRDLLCMEQSRLLKRVHGGAVTVGEMRQINSLDIRNEENSREKAELAQIACSLISEGDIIGIDAGSTAISLSHAVAENFSSLTVVTHSLDVFDILSTHSGFEVILCGGHFLKSENSFYGNLALAALDKLNLNKCFIFPSAISLNFGICDYQKDLIQLQEMYIKHSGKVFILADSSKFEKQALLKLDDMREEYFYVTDNNLSDELKKIYAENNIKIITEE